jgi:hypothetical protein
MMRTNLGHDVSSDAFKAKFVVAVIHTENVFFWVLVQTDTAMNEILRGYFIREPCGSIFHGLVKLLRAPEKIGHFSVYRGCGVRLDVWECKVRDSSFYG